MVSGRFQNVPGPGHASLQARIAWDRTNNRLAALPGTRLLALNNPGTIPDTGAYDVYLADGKTRVGTLDEEFIFETRPGDVFMLGSSVWRVEALEDDRVIVGDAAGQLPRMPFWKGDYPWRSYELGERIGVLRRRVADQIAARPGETGTTSSPTSSATTRSISTPPAPCTITSKARSTRSGAISSDETIIVETFFDAVGEAPGGGPFAVRGPHQRRVGAGAGRRAQGAHGHRDREHGQRRRHPPAPARRRARRAGPGQPGDRRPTGGRVCRRRPLRRCRTWSAGCRCARRGSASCASCPTRPCSARASASTRAGRCCCRGRAAASAPHSGCSG